MKKGLMFIFIVFLLAGVRKGFSQDDTSKIILFGDTTQFNTIEDVLELSYFKNKIVYVDIWGARCA